MLSALLVLFLAVVPTFSPPVDYTVKLAGNFGEPRPHHFHGGLDIKTDGVEGKHIYAIGDGYVSRLTTGLYGFGNAVYVTHPSGQTSIYCHLKRFSPRLERILKQWRYAHEQYEADVHLSPLQCPVSTGQLIAISGNTGNSSAPHLHLEIHDTRTWHMLDPLEFLGDCIADTVPPQLHAIKAYPQPGRGVFKGSLTNSSLGLEVYLHQQELPTAWGEVGFGIWASDYMQDSYNHFGLRETILMVDGEEVFHSIVNRIPVEHNRQVNIWGDYHHWLHHHTWYMKLFREPGCRLSMLHTNEQRGIVVFNEERNYELELILRDYWGNELRRPFTVRGQRMEIPPREVRGRLLHHDRTNVVSAPGVQLVIPAGLLPDDADMQLRIVQQGELSPTASFFAQSYPLAADCQLSMAAHRQVKDPTKLYITTSTSYNKYVGGAWKDGWVSAPVRDLGLSYTLAYDDQPPAIRPVNSAAPQLMVNIVDGGSGLRSMKGYIDGRFVLFEPVGRSANYRCLLSETPVRKTGQMHMLTIVATDNRNNTSKYQTKIQY